MQYQTTKQTFGNPPGNPAPVPKVLLTRPHGVQVPVTRTVPAPRQPVAAPDVTPIAVRIAPTAMERFRSSAPASPRVANDIVPPAPVVRPLRAAPAQPAPVPTASPVTMPAPAALSVPAPAPVPEPTPEPAPTPITASVLANQLPIDMALPGEESRWNVAAALGRTKWRGIRHNAARGLAIALVLVITMGGMLFSQSYLKLHKVFKGSAGTAAALKANVSPDLLKGEGSGRVNILLLGKGGGTHDGPDLTDTMMLASVDPVNHTTTLVSIPRDLWVNVPGQGVMKINAAWETGVYKYLGKQVNNTTDPKAVQAGFALVDQTVSDALGVDIDYNTLVDFQAFKQAVDTVGGVDINVPTDLVDPTMAWENGNNPVLAKAGEQVFNGTQALIYARSRETSSDFARAQRQRSLLVSLKTKVDTLGTLSNPLKLSGLLNSFGNNVQTDLSINNATRLYSIMSKVSAGSIGSISLADAQNSYVTTGNINGQSVVLPKAGLFNYTDIKNFVHGQLKDPYILKENAKIMVLNGTTTPGVATSEATLLKNYGYNVFSTGNTPHTGWTQTTVVDLTHKNKYTKNYLEQRFGQTASTELNDKTIPTDGADFVIIIGSDEANSTQP